jgi:uncharacterized protein YacL (UPF0231 family)
MRFYITNEGFRHVAIAEDMKLLGSYLTEDVQSSTTWCDELLSIINNVESGHIHEWEGTGNAHTLYINSDTVTITNEYTEEVLEGVSLSFFKKALMRWRTFINNDTTY